MSNARLNIAVTGEIDREGLLKSVNERFDSEAAVVVTWKRHNEHMVMLRLKHAIGLDKVL